MILADKIIMLRKKAGWSQEELAAQLGVSRQSVSKWEGAQSVPDIDRILQMSRLFGISTDYLLKDELGEPEYPVPEVQTETEPPLRRVTMEEASSFIAKRKNDAPKLALAVFMCVISPAVLLMLTDVLLEGTQLIYVGDDDTIQQAFGVTPKDGTVFLPRVMSRKKQIIPMLSPLWG